MKTIGKHIISKRKYLHLAKFKQHNDTELLQMKEYEEVVRTKAMKETKSKKYFKKVKNMKNEDKKYRPLNKDILWKSFLASFLENEGKKFNQDNYSIKNIQPLFYYFLNDLKKFKNCKNVFNVTAPDLSKGLLIVGDYGCGKTASMKALQNATAGTEMNFKMYPAKDVVRRYESCNNQMEKEEIMKEVCVGTRYFDDALSERDVNNYGKINLFSDILELRYNNKARTHLSINYDPEHPGDLKKAIEYIDKRYGPRVYDRVFEMFNIIEFKGKSRRV